MSVNATVYARMQDAMRRYARQCAQHDLDVVAIEAELAYLKTCTVARRRVLSIARRVDAGVQCLADEPNNARVVSTVAAIVADARTRVARRDDDDAADDGDVFVANDNAASSSGMQLLIDINALETTSLANERADAAADDDELSAFRARTHDAQKRLDALRARPAALSPHAVGINLRCFYSLLGRCDGGWLQDEIVQRYVSLIEAHFKEVDEGRFTFFGAWFGEALVAPRARRAVGAENVSPPTWLAASHENPLNKFPPLRADSVLFVPIFENYRVNRATSFGNGHYWVAIIFVESGIIAHWDSLCGTPQQRLSREHGVVMCALASYMNERLRRQKMPPRKWMSRRCVHAAVQRDASCGIYMLKTIELSAQYALETGLSREWPSTLEPTIVDRYRAQIACSLFDGRIVPLSDVDAASIDNDDDDDGGGGGGGPLSTTTTVPRTQSRALVATTMRGDNDDDDDDDDDDSIVHALKRVRRDDADLTSFDDVHSTAEQRRVATLLIDEAMRDMSWSSERSDVTALVFIDSPTNVRAAKALAFACLEIDANASVDTVRHFTDDADTPPPTVAVMYALDDVDAFMRCHHAKFDLDVTCVFAIQPNGAGSALTCRRATALDVSGVTWCELSVDACLPPPRALQASSQRRSAEQCSFECVDGKY